MHVCMFCDWKWSLSALPIVLRYQFKTCATVDTQCVANTKTIQDGSHCKPSIWLLKPRDLFPQRSRSSPAPLCIYFAGCHLRVLVNFFDLQIVYTYTCIIERNVMTGTSGSKSSPHSYTACPGRWKPSSLFFVNGNTQLERAKWHGVDLSSSPNAYISQ